MAVAALNPHAREGDLFGPAVAAWRARGIAISRPLPGDVVFVRALAGEFDAVVAMFHDQGHIPAAFIIISVVNTSAA